MRCGAVEKRPQGRSRRRLNRHQALPERRARARQASAANCGPRSCRPSCRRRAGRRAARRWSHATSRRSPCTHPTAALSACAGLAPASPSRCARSGAALGGRREPASFCRVRACTTITTQPLSRERDRNFGQSQGYRQQRREQSRCAGCHIGAKCVPWGQVEGMSLTVDAIVGSTGLELKSDPGVPYVYAGFGGALLGL